MLFVISLRAGSMAPGTNIFILTAAYASQGLNRTRVMEMGQGEEEKGAEKKTSVSRPDLERIASANSPISETFRLA